MEISRAEIDAVLDAHGRLVITPNALTTEGQRNIPSDLQPGESLLAFLRRHIDGVESGAWAVSIGGRTVPRAMWDKTFPKHGMHIACRAVVGKQAVQLVAVAALAFFAPAMAGGIYGALGGTYAAASAGMALGALQLGVFAAGSILINKVLAPKIKTPNAPDAAQLYGLSGQRNAARPYEPVGLLLGEMRIAPDLANQPYTWYEGDAQFLSTQLLGGINVQSVHDLSIGDTALSSYDGVSVYFDGFAGHDNQDVPLLGNADSLAGGEFVNGGPWITRSSSVGSVGLQIDVEGVLYDNTGKGGIGPNTVTLTAEYAEYGTENWVPWISEVITSASTATLRKSYSIDVAEGQYTVRAKLGVPQYNNGGGDDECRFAWTTLRSVQRDTSDYSQFGRVAIKIKASGQISGSLDTVRATYCAKPMPIWTGAEWATATMRENGLSNPGALLLLMLRGVWHDGKLQAGYGMSDEQIDIEGLKAFMLHCAAKGYTYDRWITESISLGALCQEIALAGMGEFAWTDGSRPTAVFVGASQPTSAVVNMANMLKASFSVDYTLSNAADGIEYQYQDRARNFESTTLRVTAPGVTTMLNPARVTGVGVTTEAHAAVMARYHLAQSLYQYKTINYAADIEHLDYRRLSVLSVSHDLTQWGFGGRVASAKRVDGQVHISLGEAVPVLTTPHLGLRLPGDRDYRVWPVQSFANDGETLVLAGQWPEGVPLPGEDGPAHDTLWCYDFKSTPGYKVRVVGLEPEGDLKGAKVTCVPEGPEFWDYVLNGTYAPAPNQSVIPQLGRCAVTNLRISEQVNVQGDTEWSELNTIWDTEGDYDHAQVWAGRDGSELRMVDGNAVGARSTWRIDGPGEWLVEVRPFNSGGQGGTSTAVLYITTMTARPPRNVDQFTMQDVAGGLRRFAWQYTGDAPPALAGVQIRYVPGDVVLSTAMWDSMTPLGRAGDIYSAQFETTRPEAGLWTFGIRAIDTAGQLSPGVLRVVKTLGSSFEQVQQPDLTPPPAPTGFVASGLFATVQASWDVPVYTMGHGHARTEVWAGSTPDRALAKKVAEGFAGPASFEWGLGSQVYVWARHITADGVAGAWAGPAVAQTSEDIDGLLGVISGEIGKEQLKPVLIDRIDTIDLIDKSNGVLGRSIVDVVKSQEAAQQRADQELTDLADGLIEAALAADRALESITDAGFYVDPLTGQVKIYALEQTKGEVTNLSIQMDAVTGLLSLKASTAYVDGKIAEAVLSPADLILYEGLDARITSVAQTLDSVNGQLAQKASALVVQDAVARLTTAESNLNALSGQINLRVTRAEYEANRDFVQARLNTAELQINALDVPSISATVQAVERNQMAMDESNLALIEGLLAHDESSRRFTADVAFARNELTASMQEGFASEARARQQLMALFQGEVGQLQALVNQESAARSDAIKAQANITNVALATINRDASDTALLAMEGLIAGDDARDKAAKDIASARTELNAVMQSGFEAQAQSTLELQAAIGANAAALQRESLARANADSAEARERMQLAAAVGGNQAAVEQSFAAQAGINGYLAAKYSLAVQIGSGGSAVVGGMQITGTSSGGAGPRIAVQFATDAFSVVSPDGSKGGMPFYVQPTDMTINGVSVPAGVYMDSARIGNVEAMFGRFGTLFADKVQATAISASQLTAGNGVIGGSLRSSNYVIGSSGWTLRPDGVAEFSGVIVRGTVYATSGQIGSVNISGGGLSAGSFTGYAWPASGGGFYLGPQGLLMGNHNTGQYVQIGVDGAFSIPGLSVSGGITTYSGRLDVKSATTGARTEFDGARIQIYDENNILRVYIGVPNDS